MVVLVVEKTASQAGIALRVYILQRCTLAAILRLLSRALTAAVDNVTTWSLRLRSAKFDSVLVRSQV